MASCLKKLKVRTQEIKIIEDRPLCFTMCFFKLDFSANAQPHCVHENGRSPNWNEANESSISTIEPSITSMHPHMIDQIAFGGERLFTTGFFADERLFTRVQALVYDKALLGQESFSTVITLKITFLAVNEKNFKNRKA
jgi:hypothetical protein